jgi:hypothetical protein
MIQVTWDDAYALSRPYWHTEDEIDEHPAQRTIGYFVKKSKRFLVVSQSIGIFDAETPQYGGLFFIPAGFIISTKKI